MAQLSKHHRELGADGAGKCSVPMWSCGSPAGFCDEPAYGERQVGAAFKGYVPALACPAHGGPPPPHKPDEKLPTVIVLTVPEGADVGALVYTIRQCLHDRATPNGTLDRVLASVRLLDLEAMRMGIILRHDATDTDKAHAEGFEDGNSTALRGIAGAS